MTTRARLSWVPAVAVVMLAACGGGSAGSTPSAPPATSGSTPVPSTVASTAGAGSTAATTSGPTTATGACAPLPDGIVAWWRAEGDPTDSIGDADGALQGGAGFAAGMVGRAFAFTADGQDVEVAGATALQLRHALTIEGWVNTPTAPQYGGIAGTWDDANGAYRTYLFWVLNGQLDFVLSTDGTSYQRATSSDPIPLGQWTHLAGTYDGTTIRVYVDGIEAGSAPMSGDLATNDRPFAIGRTTGGSVGANWWSGEIDELALYDRALSPNEIAAIHDAGGAGKCTG